MTANAVAVKEPFAGFDSIPHVSFIHLDAVLSTQSAKLILKRHRAMMFLLSRDVGAHPRPNAGLAEKRRTVLRAEHDMKDDAGKRLRHGVDGIVSSAGMATHSAVKQELMRRSIAGQRPTRKPALGNALGHGHLTRNQAPSGRDNPGARPETPDVVLPMVVWVVPPFQGWSVFWPTKPRALPRAGLWLHR